MNNTRIDQAKNFAQNHWITNIMGVGGAVMAR
jgi:hypothetical protein